MTPETMPMMYGELADWWPLISAPADYGEEAPMYIALLKQHARRPVREVLELGSGGGNNASWMKGDFGLTLVDLSEEMLAISRQLNPECEHAVGDMRTIRLGRTFDAVFVHDAVDYMASVDDLRAAMTTARAHLGDGGVALFTPDHVRERFEPETELGGHDGDDGRAIRYLAWSWDPDPADTRTIVDYVYALRLADGAVQVRHDRHECGLFEQATWEALLVEAGFVDVIVVEEPDDVDWSPRVMFVGVA